MEIPSIIGDIGNNILNVVTFWMTLVWLLSQLREMNDKPELFWGLCVGKFASILCLSLRRLPPLTYLSYPFSSLKLFYWHNETERWIAVLKFIYWPASSPQASSRATFAQIVLLIVPNINMTGVNKIPLYYMVFYVHSTHSWPLFCLTLRTLLW